MLGGNPGSVCALNYLVVTAALFAGAAFPAAAVVAAASLFSVRQQIAHPA
jgi:hypothetical protein